MEHISFHTRLTTKFLASLGFYCIIAHKKIQRKWKVASVIVCTIRVLITLSFLITLLTKHFDAQLEANMLERLEYTIYPIYIAFNVFYCLSLSCHHTCLPTLLNLLENLSLEGAHVNSPHRNRKSAIKMAVIYILSLSLFMVLIGFTPFIYLNEKELDHMFAFFSPLLGQHAPGGIKIFLLIIWQWVGTSADSVIPLFFCSVILNLQSQVDQFNGYIFKCNKDDKVC